LPNYQKNSLPQAGGYMRIFWIVAGIGLLGLAIIILQNRKNISIKEKGKEDGAKSE
jgi:LPXTG-motif cell wall-anchored protein